MVEDWAKFVEEQQAAEAAKQASKAAKGAKAAPASNTKVQPVFQNTISTNDDVVRAFLDWHSKNFDSLPVDFRRLLGQLIMTVIDIRDDRYKRIAEILDTEKTLAEHLKRQQSEIATLSKGMTYLMEFLARVPGFQVFIEEKEKNDGSQSRSGPS